MNLTNIPPDFEIIITEVPANSGQYFMNDMGPLYATERTQIVFHLHSAPPGVTLNRITLKSPSSQITGNMVSLDGSTVTVTDADTVPGPINFNVIINTRGGGTHEFDPQVINRPPGSQQAA